jgi:bis(5'-nucleosidyl)-tetraphosphatase
MSQRPGDTGTAGADGLPAPAPLTRRLSAGVVVLRFGSERCRLLLLRAYHHWDFPKGMVEAGEDPLAAACREVLEETGIDELRFNWGPVFRETPPYAHGKVARYYVAETDQERVVLGINPEIGRAEHDEARWVTSEDARRLLVPRVAAVLEWAVRVAGCE